MIVKGNMNVKDVKKLNLLPSHYAIFQSWSQIVYDKNIETVAEFLQEPLFCNSHIKNNKNIIFNIDMYRAGIAKIQDVYNLEEERLFNYQELSEIFGNIGNFVRVYSALKAIPKKWLRDIRENSNLCKTVKYTRPADEVLDETRMPKKTYHMYLYKKFKSEDVARITWQKEMDINLSFRNVANNA